MPINPPKPEKDQDLSQDRPTGAPKKAGADPKAKGAAREERLSEALRANLRRRKAPVQDTSEKEE